MARGRKKKIEPILTQQEMDQIEINNLNKRLRESEINKLSAETKCYKLESELIRLKREKVEEELVKKQKDLIEKHNLEKKRSKEYIEILREKYSIDQDSFSYNPDTGEILKEE